MDIPSPADASADEVRGYTDSLSRTIYLDKQKAGREDFLHELIHAIEWSLNFALDHKDLQLVARGLWSVVQDNADTQEVIDAMFGVT